MSAVAALAGGIAHARAGRVDWRTVAWMAPPSLVAAFVGASLAHLVPSRVLLAAIAALLFWNGLDLAFGLRTAPEVRRPRAAAVVSGGLIGLVGGAVGLILGTLRMPALLRSVGLPASLAVGTNLVVGFFLGLAGFTAHLVRLEVDGLVLAVCLAASLPGALLGSRLTGRFSERGLRRAIGAALLAVAVATAAGAAG